MILVYVNGVLQIPGIDYAASPTQLNFSSPPEVGAIVHVSGIHGSMAQFYGDGRSNIFHMQVDLDVNKLTNLFHDAARYYDNPAVADVLERLSIVVALVKENG